MQRSRAVVKPADLALLAYQRGAATVTDQPVLPSEGRRWRRRRPEDGDVARRGRAEAGEVLDAYEAALEALSRALPDLAALRRPRLRGKVEEQQHQLTKARTQLATARTALDAGDFGACGKAVLELRTALSGLEGRLAVSLSAELAQAVVPRTADNALKANAAARTQAQRQAATQESPRAASLAWVSLYRLVAEGLELAADVLARQPSAAKAMRPSARDGETVVLGPQELETFEDVGGLEEPKDRLNRTVGALLGGGASPGLANNGILLYGPPGTGKTLLGRAVAGEYGLRFMRFSPADIASTYQHEPAKKLRELFALAAESAPCVLFLDEIDVIAARRETLVSADQREVVTQLLNCLEDYRGCPGLVIMAATNTLDHLDPALREGRFDARIAVPLPDTAARREILEVRLPDHDVEVDWDGLDLLDLAERTEGRSGATLASIVAAAAQAARTEGCPLGQHHLLAEIERRAGQDRLHTLQDPVGWDDVVLPEATRRRLMEILAVFQRPEVARKLGVRAPAGLLLHGPPGTGKTTVAKALVTEVRASFYEKSAADLLSKWVGESEQKVAQLFARARQNRPSIIFIDEIDALTKRRSTDSVTPWEERVVSQFLRELDGLGGSEGVLLVGATNRPDIIDDAVRDRRLVAIEVPLPDGAGRTKLLEVLCREVALAPDVDLTWVADSTEGMSGADLKSLRDAAGMKAMARWTAGESGEAAVAQEDFLAALAERGVVPSRAAATRRRRVAAQTRPASRRTTM